MLFSDMTISLRNLPSDVEQAIVEKSQAEGLSLNKATAKLLETAVRKPARNSDFDEFFGSWNQAEAAEFDRALADLRRVDPVDWQE
ncbi:MAG TPA: hypothetical protein VNH18_05095 [Bryobacteraceae bacterium]|nr:hypothetical protein [Bryobacteraceae bacterium]